ncbi:YbxH family protein [Lederbergia graminis]|uniref:YbxH family protein n=1 Tax=Lederbergia graminis TaxID=735518 RepID=A0ABW0LJ40_9BACI|nr:YbxH family protein [Paenibacillus bovis]HLU23561.1 YbxH family protein [Bacillaceae bacterium]
MGAIERGGYIFEPEYSVIEQKAAIHVYQNGEFIEELKFKFRGAAPEPSQIEQVVDAYCQSHGI